MTVTSKLAQQIMDGLESQKTGYNKLLELAGQQKEAIDAGDDETLVRVIQNKEQHLRSMQELERALKESADTLTDGDRQDLQERARPLQNEVLGLMEKLIELENTCTETLKAKALNTREELSELKTRKNNIKQYGMFGAKGTEFSGDA
ncbi:flagellar export chaperone FlgN [Nitrospina sp. 32_T5]|uniref:flagellar export chaperone FlgN n=1 Tax=unclassified Nitrospina TaxID=2638683 RepID=UPI003F9E4BD2